MVKSIGEGGNSTQPEIQFADNLRKQRLAKGWSVPELKQRSGVSEAMISAIENYRRVPTVKVACHLAEALDTTVSYLLGETTVDVLTPLPKTKQKVLIDPDTNLERWVLSPATHSSGLEFIRNVLPAFSATGIFPPHKPGTVEYLVVGQGQLMATVEEREEKLNEGDALYMQADRSHSFRNPWDSPCIYYVIIHSPSS